MQIVMTRIFKMNMRWIKTAACMVVALCVDNVYSLDIGAVWKNGELWKMKRQPTWDDLSFESVSDTCTRVSQRNLVTFGRHQVEGNVTLDWKVPSDGAKKPDDGVEPVKDDQKDMTDEKQKEPTDLETERAARYSELCRVTCEIYNRSDQEEINKEAFDNYVSSYKSEVGRISGAKMTKVRIPPNKSATKVEAFQWETPQGAARLYMATTTIKKDKKKEEKKDEKKEGKKEEKKTKDGGARMEYIRLVLAPNAAGLENSVSHGKEEKRRQKDSVVKEKNGITWIKGLPMVEQGMKAAALPAQLTRLFMYYGRDGVSLDAVSALCETPDEDGYTREDMDEIIHQVAHEYRLKVKNVSSQWAGREDYMKDYTSKARKDGKLVGDGDTIDTLSLDPELWLSLFAKKKSDCNKWLASIRSCIDAGTPVIWLVMRGNFYVDVTDSRNTEGAHLRLIIGYDATKGKEKIIYTEPWGEKGERCTMELPKAYAVTDAALILRQ